MRAAARASVHCLSEIEQQVHLFLRRIQKKKIKAKNQNGQINGE